MTVTNLAYELIDNVPWEDAPPLSANGKEVASAYLEAFQAAISLVPTKGLKVDFLDDDWDFNPYYANVNSPDYKLIFKGLPAEVKDLCKFYAMTCLGERSKVSTVGGRLRSFKTTVATILEASGRQSFSLITTDDIIDAIERGDIAAGTAAQRYASAWQIWRFLMRECRMPLPVNLEKLKKLGREASRQASAEADARKTPDIPIPYFDAILKALIKIMRDDGANHNRRATACLLTIASQTGLRTSDLLPLRTHQLRTTKIKSSGRNASFIRYKSQKPSREGEPLKEFDVFSNELCTEAFRTLLALRESCPLATGNDFLYVLNASGTSKDGLPVLASRFYKEYTALLAEEIPEASTKEWPGIPKRSFKVGSERDGSRRAIRISVPSVKQYRVRMCTALYERGVPLLYIHRYLGHLSATMIGYYARPKDTYQENMAYSASIVREIVLEDARVLGGLYGDDVKRGIERLADESGIKVESDVKGVVSSFGDKVVIRAKRGGVCIKTSILTCDKDARTNELMCAYGICPNLHHFYFMADVSYVDFLVLQDTYETAISAGRLREAEKELNKLKDVCRRKLLPELDELDREIGRKGEERVLERHPHLLDIIRHRDEIRKEIDLWLMR